MNNSLDRLTIRGFKSIRTLEDLPLGNLNVFIGGNGADKSNLLEFFRLLRAVIDGRLNQYIADGGGISDFLFNGRKTTARMEFETHFGARGYRFAIRPGPLENALLTGEARYYQYGQTGWQPLGDSPNGTSLLVKEARGSSADSQYSRPVYEATASWQVYHFHDTSATAAMRHYEIVQDNRILRFNAANLAPYLLRLRREYPESYQEILNAAQLALPFFADFLLEETVFGEAQKVNLAWQQKGSDYPMQPYHLSDGSLRFICLSTALLQPTPPSTIVIDEPELGLHPFAIGLLAELIQSAAQRTQLIVATQSPTLIDHFAMEDVVVVHRRDGASTFERLQEADFNVWLESYSVGELWTKNVLSGEPVYE